MTTENKVSASYQWDTLFKHVCRCGYRYVYMPDCIKIAGFEQKIPVFFISNAGMCTIFLKSMLE